MSDAAVGGSAGTYLVGLWERMGIADDIKQKAIPQKSGGEVAARVAEGKADVGLTLIGEIAPVKGARVIGKLPAPFGSDTIYAGGISTGCADKRRSRRFHRRAGASGAARRLDRRGVSSRRDRSSELRRRPRTRGAAERGL